MMKIQFVRTTLYDSIVYNVGELLETKDWIGESFIMAGDAVRPVAYEDKTTNTHLPQVRVRAIKEFKFDELSLKVGDHLNNVSPTTAQYLIDQGDAVHDPHPFEESSLPGETEPPLDTKTLDECERLFG